MKLNTKNAVKVSVNSKAKTIKFTTQYFKNITDGEKTLGASKNFMILNKNRLDKMIADGYKVIDVTAQVQKSGEIWTPKFIVGNEELEEKIRQYTVNKLQRKRRTICKRSRSKNGAFMGTITNFTR